MSIFPPPVRAPLCPFVSSSEANFYGNKYLGLTGPPADRGQGPSPSLSLIQGSLRLLPNLQSAFFPAFYSYQFVYFSALDRILKSTFLKGRPQTDMSLSPWSLLWRCHLVFLLPAPRTQTLLVLALGSATRP